MVSIPRPGRSVLNQDIDVSRMPRRLRGFAIVFLLALGVRLILLFGLHRYEIGRSEAVRIAISLAQHRAFADPYAIPTGPTAHTGPIYPALLAPIYALLGDTPAADHARFALNAAAAAAGYALLPLVGEALGLGWQVGMLAGLAGALVPLHHWPECLGEFENTWTGLFLELSLLQFLRFLRTGYFVLRGALAGGLVWGIGVLLSPTVAPVLAGLIAIAWWKLRPGARTMIRWNMTLLATILVLMAPWIARNWVRQLGLTFVRDDFGLELFVSNHDGSTPVAEINYASPYWRDVHPHVSLAAALELKRVGERAFERRKFHEAVEWIRAHPRRFALLTVQRIARFWFTHVPRFAWAFWAVTILAIAGWVRLLAQARFAAAVSAAVLCGYSAAFSVIESSVRYQHPIWWCLVLLSTWMAVETLRKLFPAFLADAPRHPVLQA